MQARVMSVLESIGAAMPGIGFLLGGVIATTLSTRATFLMAGIGVVAIAALAAPLLGTRWAEAGPPKRPRDLDAADEIMVELIPGG